MTNQLFGGQPVVSFADPASRRNFLKWAAVLGVGGSLAIASRERWASAQNDGGDIGILNYALTLEYLEANFYSRAVRAGFLSGRAAELITAIRDHEREHVSAISSTIESLGGTPVDKPRFTYPAGTFDDKAKWLDTAYDFARLAVRAYQGQVTRIKSVDILAAAGGIAGVESRHAAIIADLTGNDPFPAPLEQHASKRRVTKTIRPFFRG